MFLKQDRRLGGGGSAAASAIGLCLLLISTPAGAQNQDPFQSAPVTTPAAPAAPAPKPEPQPRPQPRHPVEPDPYAVMPPSAYAPPPPPVPSLPPSNVIWAHIRQVALADGIDVPLASDPLFDISSASPQTRILVGAWGPGAWQGMDEDRVMLIILAVDGGTNVRGVVARSTGVAWSDFSAPMMGNRFSIHIQTTYEASGRFNTTRALEDEYWQFQLQPDGRLYGSRSSSPATVVLAKLQ